MDEEAIKGLFDGLEDQITADRLQKQGAYAVTAAKITGLVFTEAVITGVPADLAKEMAQDSWMSIMGFQGLDSETLTEEAPE